MQTQRLVAKKLLRCGYTTGSCAAAAAAAAARLLLTGSAPAAAPLCLPGGERRSLPVEALELFEGGARCSIKKDAGDDPDVTDGLLVCAAVTRCESGFYVDGGKGVGRVTRPGLDQPVGAAAINSTPRRMILEALRSEAFAAGYAGGLSALISIPGGEAAAQRTFNPRLGIVGGLSILGTSGVVEPMSERALVETLRLELSQLRARGESRLLLTPGNYGEAFARETLGLPAGFLLQCANNIGETLDMACELGFTQLLLVGHIGKLVKLGVGLFNTHSKNGDARLETLTACALEAGAGLPLLAGVLHSATTDAALALLYEAGLLEPVMTLLGERIAAALARRVPETLELGFVCFTNAPPMSGVLTQSKNAPALLAAWRKE